MMYFLSLIHYLYYSSLFNGFSYFQKVGCDWIVDSQAKEDDCGICQGDGTKCDKKEGMYIKQNRHAGYREIVVIPKNARNIRIEEKDHSENYISIGSLYVKKFFLNGER